MGRVGFTIAVAVMVALCACAESVRGQCDSNWIAWDKDQRLDGVVFAMTTWDPDGHGALPEVLVVGGSFLHAGTQSINRIAGWNGMNWSTFGTGMSGTVYALRVFRGELIAGGVFGYSDGIETVGAAAWNGASWRRLNGWYGGSVYAIAEYRDELILAGQRIYDGIDYSTIAAWNGDSVHNLGRGTSNSIFALTATSDELYLGGSFLSGWNQLLRGIAQWNGTNAGPMGPGMNQRVNALGIYKDQVIAGGEFASSGATTLNSIGSWDGSMWSAVGGGVSPGTHASVNAILNVRGDLVIAGRFSDAGGVSARGIARWDGSSWHPLGSGISSDAYCLANWGGAVYVGGSLSTAGGFPSPYIAHYGFVGPTPAIFQQPASPSVCAGSSVSLRTTATGDGVLSYRWRKSGVELVDGGEVMGTQTNTLVFVHAGVGDAGEYDCVVKLNDCTQATSNIATLTVYPTNTADGNGDAVVDGRDVQGMVDALVGLSPVSAALCAYELNGDGIVSEADVDAFVGRVLTD